MAAPVANTHENVALWCVRAPPRRGRLPAQDRPRPSSLPPQTRPDQRLWIVESDFRTSGSTSRVDPTNAPDVPFCPAARMATVVVLSRRSVLPAMRPIADSGAAPAGLWRRTAPSLRVSLARGRAQGRLGCSTRLGRRVRAEEGEGGPPPEPTASQGARLELDVPH